MGKGKRISLIRGVKLVDPETGNVREDAEIRIGGGKIESVRLGEPGGAAGSGTEFDGAGLYAIPGLIDTHVHSLGIYTEDMPGLFDLGWVRRQQEKNYAAFLRAGVTTVRDMGAPTKMIAEAADWAQRNPALAPRILYAGPVFTVKGGYPDFAHRTPPPVRLLTGFVRAEVRGRLDARSLVDRVADTGACCIKTCFQSRKFDDRRTRLKTIPLPWLREIIDRAHGHGLPVAVHCAYKEDLLKILDLPFDSFEHTACDADLGAEAAARLAAKGAPVSGTLMTFALIDHVNEYEELIERDMARYEPKPLENVRASLARLRRGESTSRFFGSDVVVNGPEQVRRNVRLLVEAGVKIVNGTDSGGAITPCGCPAWEFAEMKRCGLGALEILRSATTLAAATVGRPDLGRISAGAAADVVLLRSNPLEDTAAFGDVAAVFRDGRLVHEAAV